MQLDRRGFVVATLATTLAGCAAQGARTAADVEEPTARLRAVEQSVGGRLGAFVLDTGTGESFGWRADERFCHCSTFKLSQAALVLREAEAGRLDLAEELAINRADLANYSPVAQAAVDAGKDRLPIATLAEAVQVTSDNAAANALTRRLGGPAAITRFWRDIGDNVSRIDDYEPGVNVILPGTEENSTTPRAMAQTVQRLALGDVLQPASRERLLGWMEATQSGARRIRAALPAGWRGFDKTGTGMREGIGNKTNDLAVLMPPGGRAPLIVTAYLETGYSADTRRADEAALRAVGEVAIGWAG